MGRELREEMPREGKGEGKTWKESNGKGHGEGLEVREWSQGKE